MADERFDATMMRLASAAVYPATPHLRPRVAAQLRATPPGARPERGPRVVLALAAAAVAAVAFGVALAAPPSRTAIADFFGIRGERIERLPTPAPGVTPTPLPTPEGITAYATPIALEAAGPAIGFEPVLPPGTNASPAAYTVRYQDGPGGAALILEYPDFDLWEGRLGGIFGKGLPAEAVLKELTINGAPAAWIAGGGHIVRYEDATGREVVGSQRTVARNTLVWSTAYANYRIETDLALERAVEIARSLP